MAEPFDEEKELTPDELDRLRRRTLIRRVVVIVVVVAMIATLLIPVVVRVVRVPAEPDGILADQARIASNRMSV